jgi:hypothetical protein
MMKRWPITDAARRAIVRRLAEILIDEKSDRRTTISAAKALMSAEAQNQLDEHKVVDVSVSRIAEYEAIAADLGIDAAEVRRIG